MAQHGNVREGCYQPVSFLVHVSWYWSFIPLVLEYFITETALEANIQFALNLHYKLCIIKKSQGIQLMASMYSSITVQGNQDPVRVAID